MNLKRLHSNFHEDISIGRQKVFNRSSNYSYPAGNIDMVEYLTLPSSTLLAIQSPRDWKILLDIHLRLLGLHPARRTTIEETFPMIGRDSPSTHMTGEFYLYVHNRHGAFIANRNSSLFRSPKYSYTIGTPHIHTEWGGKKYNLDLRSKQLAIHHAYDPISDYSVTPPNPGEKIFLGCSHKEISELLRMKGIPPFVRKTFPILRKNNVALQILFELFNPQSKLSE
jgi:tRNA(Ile)-lysidine synthetase-like protein